MSSHLQGKLINWTCLRTKGCWFYYKCECKEASQGKEWRWYWGKDYWSCWWHSPSWSKAVEGWPVDDRKEQVDVGGCSSRTLSYFCSLRGWLNALGYHFFQNSRELMELCNKKMYRYWKLEIVSSGGEKILCTYRHSEKSGWRNSLFLGRLNELKQRR